MNTVVSCLLYFKSVDSLFPGMLANLVVLLGSHYLLGEPGGWGYNPSSALAPDPEAPTRVQRLYAAWRRLRPRAYFEGLLPQQDAAYPILGFYIFAVTYASLYLLHPAVKLAYPEAYDVIQYSILGLVSALLLFMIWPPALKNKQVLVWAWPGIIFYALFLVGGNLALMNGFAMPHLFLFLLNLVMAMLFFPWPMVLGMVAGAVVLNGLFFVYYMKGYTMQLGDESSTYFTIMYGILLASSVLMALFRHQQFYRDLEKSNEALSQAHATTQSALLEGFKEKVGLLSTLHQAGVNSLPALVKQTQALYMQGQVPLSKHPALLKMIKDLEEHLVPMALSLDRIESRVMDYLRLQVRKIPLRPVLEEVKRVLQQQNLHQHVQFHMKTEHVVLTCDPQRVVTLLVNGTTLLRTAAGADQPIHVVVCSTQLTCALESVREGYTKKVAAISFTMTTLDTLPTPAAAYAVQMQRDPLPVAETPQALLPITNQRIVRAHYGYAEQAEHTYQYVLPVDVRALRTPDMDRAYMDVGAELARADDTYPGAQAQEQALLEAVQERTSTDLRRVRTALEMIKWYHGSAQRKTGEPFYLHPVAVAQIVLDYQQDEATVLGALLHDTVEDTPMLIENIETAFGTEVMSIVAGVTHLASYKDSFHKVKLSADENMTMLLGLADDRALYVKLADRMHNMRTIHGKAHAKQVETAQETLRFYVLLAEKLGLHMAAEELKARCLAVLNEEKRAVVSKRA